MVKPARVAGEQTGVCESIGRAHWVYLGGVFIFLRDGVLPRREWSVLESRRVDGQTREGSG